MATKTKIYLDNNATTPLDPRVLDVMHSEYAKWPLNPSSPHFFGQRAREYLTQARATIATYLDVNLSEIVFTSGGTESLNLLIQGVLEKGPTGHLITSDLDHACVYNSAKACEQKGYQVTYLSPGLRGAPSPEEVKAALCENTRLIVLSAVNGETGVKLDVNGVAMIAKQARIPLILDGVALLGKAPIHLPQGVMGMGFSGHKIHGPQGIGFAFIRSGLPLQAQLIGGGQEHQRRSGTENLIAIIGLAKAISILADEGESAMRHMEKLQTQLETGLCCALPGVKINGEGPRVVNTSNFTFQDIEGEVLLARLDQLGIAVSHGAACSSGALEPSRVLLKMGLSQQQAASSLRFSLSRMTTEDEIQAAIRATLTIIQSLHLPFC